MCSKNFIVGIFARKLNFDRTSVENLPINTPKVSLEFMQSVLDYVKKKIGSKELNGQSYNPWGFIMRRLNDKNLTIGDLAEFLATPPQKIAEARAEILKPCVSHSMVIRFIADQLEIAPAEINMDAPVSSLIPPICAHDPNGYLTLLLWCGEFFRKPVPKDMPSDTPVRRVITYFADKLVYNEKKRVP